MHLLPFIMSNEYIRDIANYFHEWSAINMTGILNGGGGGVSTVDLVFREGYKREKSHFNYA